MAPYGGKSEYLLPAMTLALGAISPRFLLLFFLLSLAHAYPLTAKSVYDPDEIYYMNGDIRCLRCAPGNFVFKQCTIEDTESVCAPCHPGQTYSEHLTGLNRCLPCTVCRTDQEEVSPCTITKNSICKCKKGTYCPPGDPCEICLKCTTRCPPDQVVQTPCNSTSDTQCGTPETASSTLTAILVPFVVIGFILLAALVVWFFCCKKNGDGSKWIPKILTLSSRHDETPAGDTRTPFLPQRPKLRFKDTIKDNEQNEVVNKTFNVFVELVPAKDFEKFVRELGLPGNCIEWAKRDNTGTYNQQYDMLLRLHQDKKFDVNIWINTLHAMRLGKVAQDITEKLIEDGLFEKSNQG